MLSIPEKQVFGEDAQTCRFTGLPLESGSGALSIEEQAISNLGKLEYDLAELTQRRKDHASDLQGKITERSNVAIADAVAPGPASSQREVPPSNWQTLTPRSATCRAARPRLPLNTNLSRSRSRKFARGSPRKAFWQSTARQRPARGAAWSIIEVGHDRRFLLNEPRC